MIYDDVKQQHSDIASLQHHWRDLIGTTPPTATSFTWALRELSFYEVSKAISRTSRINYKYDRSLTPNKLFVFFGQQLATARQSASSQENHE